MDWEQIERKWQAMACRIRADRKDVNAPLSEAEPATADTARAPDGALQSRVEAAV